MKLPKLLTIGLAIAAGILIPCHGASILENRAKLEGAKVEAEAAAAADPTNTELADISADKAQALADFDAIQEGRFGAGWLTRWRNSSYDNEDDEAIDIYIAGNSFDWFPGINLGALSVAKRKELAAHLAIKTPLQTEDINTVVWMNIYNPDLADRIEEFAVLLPSQGAHDTHYFAFKHLGVLGRPGRGLAWTQHMTTAEWFELAAADAPFQPEVFAAMRDHLLVTAAKLLIDKRKAAGQPVEGPEFDTAFAPVLAALKAPKFDGLAAAVTALGLDMTVPSPDYTAPEALAAGVESAAANKTKFATAWGAQVPYQSGLGSVMFVKGEAAYTTWRDGLLASE